MPFSLRQVFLSEVVKCFLIRHLFKKKSKIQILMKPPPKQRLSGLLDLSTLHLSAFTSEVVISTHMPLVLIISSWFPFLELLLTKSEAKWSFTSRDGVGLPFNFHFAFMLFLVSSGPAPPGIGCLSDCWFHMPHPETAESSCSLPCFCSPFMVYQFLGSHFH